MSFDNNDGSHTVTVVKDGGSAQNFTVIDNPSAPTYYAYSVDTSDGSTLALDSETGMVWVYGPDGEVSAGMSPAWAIDADGTAVPTHYTIDGSSVVQHVDLSNAAISYPVVADPWLGMAIFKSTGDYKGTNSHPGPYLKAVTSIWGRSIQMGLAQGGFLFVHWAAGQAILNTAGWAELARKQPKVKTWAMRQQYECHVLGAYTPVTGGFAWELETFRPSRPYWLTDGGATTFKCNWPKKK